MTNDEIKQAIEAGNQAAIAEALKFEQLKALICKLIGKEGEKIDINIEVKFDKYEKKPRLSIETDDLFDCWGTCGRKVWKHIYLGSKQNNFLDKNVDYPNMERVYVVLKWCCQHHSGEINWMDFAELLFDFGTRPGEWQAQLDNEECQFID